MKKVKFIIIRKILKRIFKGSYKYNYSLDLVTRLDNLNGYQEIILASKEGNYYLEKGNDGVKLSDNFYRISKRETRCLSSYDYSLKRVNKDSIILFFDRIDKADDSAFLLYEYFISMGFKNCFYSIGKCSDYYKISDCLLYGSKKFDDVYKQSDFIISTCCDNLVMNYKGYRFDKNHCDFNTKFIFLQHGVISNDLSKWLITKRFNKIIVSTAFEFSNVSRVVDEKRIFKCGLPRFGRLVDLAKEYVIIAPTYRNYESDYLNFWNVFLNDKRFLDFYKDKKIILICHPLVDVSGFDVCFESYNSADVDYSFYINRCCALITDYSSIFMDVLYLKKKVMFYQFDNEEFFSNHTSESYFDYSNNEYCMSFSNVDEFLTNVLIDCINYDGFYYRDSHVKRAFEFIVNEEY